MYNSRVVYLVASYLVLLVSRAEAQQCSIARVCVTDLTDSDCTFGMVYTPNSAIFGCCPGCQMPAQNPDPGVIEPPSSGCQSPASCLSDGRFAPVQCKGDMFTGRCFCSDEDGNRIFGQMWRNQASEMTCACSRRRAELEKAGRQDVTLHCTASGDYEPLQCDDGLCWCAQPRTGQPTAHPVPEQDMELLPCYSAAVTGEQYLRRCESSVIALGRISREQTEHGTTFLGNPVTFCDYDGSFGPFQIRNGIAWCTGRDGEVLGSWQVEASAMGNMNCNCARDSAIHFPERGMTVTEICTGNGNYRPNQNAGDVFYCVDTDGYVVGDLADAWPADNCASYA